ncbi:MAG: type II secretion system protein M [Desulfuromonadales bacterium]|nr:type II secretion system protein M [Desulfuromonadales bacterium]
MTLPQINPRERLALIVGALVVLMTVLVMGVILPYRAAMANLDTRIASRQQQAQEIQSLRQEYLLLQRQLAEAEARAAKSRDFSLFSFIENTAGQVAGRENLVYMRPQVGATQDGIREEAVEVKLEKVQLDQLIRFLHALESTDAYLQVKNLRVRTRFDNRAQIDAVMTISMFGRSA